MSSCCFLLDLVDDLDHEVAIFLVPGFTSTALFTGVLVGSAGNTLAGRGPHLLGCDVKIVRRTHFAGVSHETKSWILADLLRGRDRQRQSGVSAIGLVMNGWRGGKQWAGKMTLVLRARQAS